MTAYHYTHFAHSTFRLAELEHITGVSPVLIRDWRRRDLIHPSLEKTDGGFHARTVAEFLLIRKLSDHGIGPKLVYGWTGAYSELILRHALDDAAAWSSQEAWEAHGQRSFSRPLARYMVIYTPPNGFQELDDLSVLTADGREVATIVDLAALGRRFRERAGRPLGDVTLI